MTARKPKPRKPAPRKGSKATLAQRVSDLERLADWNSDCITVLRNELEALQTRKRFRDASHDAPVSNANETVCASGTLVAPLTPPVQSWWRRFLDHMGSA